jgi:hypothetical protein
VTPQSVAIASLTTCDALPFGTFERAGVARSVAMKLTGHKTESVYRRYAIVAEQDLREDVETLARVTLASH